MKFVYKRLIFIRLIYLKARANLGSIDPFNLAGGRLKASKRDTSMSDGGLLKVVIEIFVNQRSVKLIYSGRITLMSSKVLIHQLKMNAQQVVMLNSVPLKADFPLFMECIKYQLVDNQTMRYLCLR